MSMTHFTTKEHGDVLIQGAAGDHVGVHNWSCLSLDTVLWRASSISHVGSTQESKPCTLPRQHSGASPNNEGVGELALNV